MSHNATRLAAICAALLLAGATGHAGAQSEVKEAFKKTERGLGELLQGMGQELKKAQKKVAKPDAAKKDK